MQGESKEDSVHIEDKRRFNPDGTMRQDEPETTKTGGGEIPKEAKNDFEINFSTFILSLASSVQISLGLIAHPMTQKPEINLVSARQTIDILGMLEDKTKGNLQSNEGTLLKQILFELRMQYVEIAKKK